MDVEQKLNDMKAESKEYMESINALKLMEHALSFTDELERLTGRQHLPATVLIGCLMNEVNRLSTKFDSIILADKLAKSFNGMKKYMDENFMKKE